MAYVVQSALVVATDSEGKHRYLYQGAEVPADIPAAEVKRLADEGFIADTGSVVDAEAGENEAEPTPARRGRGR